MFLDSLCSYLIQIHYYVFSVITDYNMTRKSVNNKMHTYAKKFMYHFNTKTYKPYTETKPYTSVNQMTLGKGTHTRYGDI